MFKNSLIFLTVFCLTVAVTFANEFLYPSVDAPVFSIIFPDNWEVNFEGHVLQSSPPDGSIYLGLWALEKVQNLEAALKVIDSAIAMLVSDVKWQNPEEQLINEIASIIISGEGKAEGQQIVSLEVAVFSPDGENEYILLYYGTPDAREKYDQDLSEIIQSISGENEEYQEE